MAMIKELEMRTAIETLLKVSTLSVLSRTLNVVFYKEAAKDAVMPYVVFDFPNSVNFGTLENFVMDVDIWDNAVDTNTLMTLADTINKSLHKNTIYIPDKMSITTYLDNTLAPPDDDKKINRRKYVYQARTYQSEYRI